MNTQLATMEYTNQNAIDNALLELKTAFKVATIKERRYYVKQHKIVRLIKNDYWK